MSAAGSEEGEMPRIKLPPKRTMIRIVGEQLAVRLNRRDVRSDRLRQLPAPRGNAFRLLSVRPSSSNRSAMSAR
jgi:hypothetical protein